MLLEQLDLFDVPVSDAQKALDLFRQAKATPERRREALNALSRHLQGIGLLDRPDEQLVQDLKEEELRWLFATSDRRWPRLPDRVDGDVVRTHPFFRDGLAEALRRSRIAQRLIVRQGSALGGRDLDVLLRSLDLGTSLHEKVKPQEALADLAATADALVAFREEEMQRGGRPIGDARPGDTAYWLTHGRDGAPRTMLGLVTRVSKDRGFLDAQALVVMGEEDRPLYRALPTWLTGHPDLQSERWQRLFRVQERVVLTSFAYCVAEGYDLALPTPDEFRKAVLTAVPGAEAKDIWWASLELQQSVETQYHIRAYTEAAASAVAEYVRHTMPEAAMQAHVKHYEHRFLGRDERKLLAPLFAALAAEDTEEGVRRLLADAHWHSRIQTTRGETDFCHRVSWRHSYMTELLVIGVAASHDERLIAEAMATGGREQGGLEPCDGQGYGWIEETPAGKTVLHPNPNPPCSLQAVLF